MKPFEPLTRLLPDGFRPFALPRARSQQAERLAGIIKVDAADLPLIRLGPRFHYRPFKIAKPDGRERRLLAPSPALKALQRQLLDNYLGRMPVHACATAYRAGYSAVRNARSHARQKLVATVDLRDFFESTAAARVRTFFVREGWRDEELRTLMRLCMHRNGLPQGAPTSPCLSNLVNVPLDERLARLAQSNGAIYTRYGDDLTFSWSSDSMPGVFQREAEDVLHAAGYEIQPLKGWRVTPIRDRPCVTGLVLTGDGGLSVPWSLRWRIWSLRWKSWWSADSDDIARLNGYKGYVRMLE